jgi:hypothetical protein
MKATARTGVTTHWPYRELQKPAGSLKDSLRRSYANTRRRSVRSKHLPTIQINDGSWYKADDYIHECCACGLSHDVKFKLENGVLFMCWTTNDHETRKSRRESGVKVTKAK